MTKMICTIGPAVAEGDGIQSLVDAGMRIGRLNFSHVKPGDYTFPEAMLEKLRAAAGTHASLEQDFNTRAALLDTKGPEIRTGSIGDGSGKINLVDGESLLVTTDPAFKDDCTSDRLYVDYTSIASTVEAGSLILLDDGLIGLRVVECRPSSDADESDEVSCIVENGGSLGGTKGVNLPGCVLDLPAMTEKDKQDLMWGCRVGVDYVAASFVRKASDVRAVIAHLERCCDAVRAERSGASGGGRGGGGGVIRPQVISKIENKEGVTNFKEILAASDGIMVARGDLGVEVNFAELLVVQKSMVRACNDVGKPVIVATQMLDSMMRNPRPTRAEVTDVGNAVLDGADCVMLSGETANGKYPRVAADTMMEVVGHADAQIDGLSYVDYSGFALTTEWRRRMYAEIATGANELDTIAAGAVQAASSCSADLIVVITREGKTARHLAKFRPSVPVLAFCATAGAARQLVMHRGIMPVVLDESLVQGEDETGRLVEAMRTAKEIGWARDGDRVVLVDAEIWRSDSTTFTKANTMKIFTVGPQGQRGRAERYAKRIAGDAP